MTVVLVISWMVDRLAVSDSGGLLVHSMVHKMIDYFSTYIFSSSMRIGSDGPMASTVPSMIFRNLDLGTLKYSPTLYT